MRKKTKTKRKTDNIHYHYWDLPGKIFPKTKNNKSKDYASELIRLYRSLKYNEKLLQHSAQIAVFNVKSITKKDGYITSPKEVFNSIEDFVYHYENYCYRTFSVREKILHFINEIIPVGFKDKDVDIKNMMIQPILNETKIIKDLDKFFDSTNPLSKVIKDRNALTHRLYYGEEFDHFLRPMENAGDKEEKWFKDWQKIISSHANIATKSYGVLMDINHGISNKIYKYKTKK